MNMGMRSTCLSPSGSSCLHYPSSWPLALCPLNTHTSVHLPLSTLGTCPEDIWNCLKYVSSHVPPVHLYTTLATCVVFLHTETCTEMFEACGSAPAPSGSQSCVHITDFWDTAGQERFQSMHASYYHKAHACIMV